MTEKLYEQDAEIREFTARVLSCDRSAEGYEIVLDRTAFFPEGGGQKSDRGTLNGGKVKDVQIQNGVIVHLCDAPLSEGESVTGTLDDARRLRMMQHHSGEHIISGLIKKLYGFNNVGFNLSDEQVTLDCDGFLSEEDAARLELEANRIVRENRKITVRFPSYEEAQKMDYRAKADIRENLRLVEIEGVDLCACCAPHVKFTGQVGLIKIMDRIRYKGGTRLHILCGEDALRAFQIRSDELTKISRSFSVKPEEAFEAVKKNLEECERLKSAVKKLTAEKIERIAEGSDPAKKNLCLFEEDFSAQDRIELCDRLCEKHAGICAVLSGSDETGYSGVIGRKSGGMKSLAAVINEALSGRGGGTDGMYHGSLRTTREKILDFFQNLD